MDTLDLEYTSMIDFSAQAPIFGTRVLDEISKIDNNESREILLKLSKAEVKFSKLAAACKARDSEITRLEKINNDLKNLLKSTDTEDLSLKLQHMQFLNRALEQKFQESQIKIYNLEKNEKKELNNLRFRAGELEKDNKYLDETSKNLKDQLIIIDSEKNYLQSRNAALEKKIKQLEVEKEKAELDIPPQQVTKGKNAEPEIPQKSSLASALKLFQEFPLSRS